MRKRNRHAAEIRVQLPEWVPKSVADYIRNNLSQEWQSDRLLRALSIDNRMERVWKELVKRKRSNYQRTESYLHPATDPGTWDEQYAKALHLQSGLPPELANSWVALHARLTVGLGLTGSETTQELALIFFFCNLRDLCLRQDLRTTTKINAKNAKNHYLAMAERIRLDAKKHDSGRLLAAAIEYEFIAERVAPTALVVPRKRRGNERQNAFVLMIACAAKVMFGSQLYGVVAIIASVVFEGEVWSPDRVRKIVSNPANNSKKT